MKPIVVVGIGAVVVVGTLLAFSKPAKAATTSSTAQKPKQPKAPATPVIFRPTPGAPNIPVQPAVQPDQQEESGPIQEGTPDQPASAGRRFVRRWR